MADTNDELFQLTLAHIRFFWKYSLIMERVKLLMNVSLTAPLDV